MSQPIFVVLGATGAQGGSVVDAILEFNKKHADEAFKIRGVARSTTSERADALRKKGVELAAANMTKPEELKKAFEGATHLFAVTSFWDKETMGHEFEVGKVIANEAIAAGIQYVWWSELANAEQVSGGKYKVPHFDDKAKVGDYMRSKGLKVIAVAPAFYYSNWLHAFAPSVADDGALEWKVPMSASAMVTAFEVSDTGLVVGATLENPDAYVGKFIPIAGAHMPVSSYIESIGKAAGVKTRVVSVPREVFSTFPFPGAEEIAHMCGWFEDFHYYGPKADLEWAKKITNGKLTSWDDWLAKHVDEFKAKTKSA